MGKYRAYLGNRNNYMFDSDKPSRRRKSKVVPLLLILGLIAYMGVSTKQGTEIISKIYKVKDTPITVETLSNKVSLEGKLYNLVDLLSNRIYGERKLPVYSVDNSDNKVALSFDAAWGAEDFKRIMKILKKHNIKVTFFMTGGWVKDNPQYVKQLVKEGHDLGNHSQSHPDMTTLGKEQIVEEIKQVHDQVKDLTGYEMKLFRAPYGAYNDNVIETVTEQGYYPIQWSVDSLDWKDYGADSIINTVCNHSQLKSGAIILCHNGAKYTADALEKLILGIEENGYKIVPVSKLIYTDNYTIDPTGKQVLETDEKAEESSVSED